MSEQDDRCPECGGETEWLTIRRERVSGGIWRTWQKRCAICGHVLTEDSGVTLALGTRTDAEPAVNP